MSARIRLVLSIALLLSVAGTSPLLAQRTPAKKGAPTSQSEDFRQKAPAPLAAKPMKLPLPFETTLPNGLKVVILEDKRVPLVSYSLAFRTGNANNPADLPGLTLFMAGLLNEGTDSRTSKQIADEIARIGATVGANATSDYTTVSASSLSKFSEEALRLLADVALHPSFPQNEIDIAKQNTKQGLLQQRAKPSFLANERLARTLFGTHPYSVISTTPEAIDSMTRERLLSFHRQAFIPNNAVLFVVGDVMRADVLKEISTLFGDWQRGTALSSSFPQPPTRTSRAIYLVDRPASQQSTIVIADLAIKTSSPDYYAMEVLHTILGGSFSPRLDSNLRENKGYTYGARTDLDVRRDVGTFRSISDVRTEVTGPALKEFFYELDRIRTEPVPEQELSDNKAFITGVLPIILETQEGLIGQLINIKMYDLPADYLQTYSAKINAVTAADVQRVAQKYLQTDRSAIVIVGDANAIMAQIKPYAETVEIFDMAGKRKELTASTNTNAGPAANVDGKWDLVITGPTGGTIPAVLTIKQEGDKISGTVLSQLGESPLKSTTMKGSTFDTVLSLNMGGQTIDAQVSGTLENDSLKGTLTLPNYPAMQFVGTRAK